MSTSKSNSMFLVLCIVVALTVEANTFLRAVPKSMADRVSEEDVQTSLLEEIEASLGSGLAAKRISDIKAQLRPTFSSLPKNQHGNLDHVTTRYALHRVFIQRHGWAIKGLEPANEAMNSSAQGILKDQVPSYIQNLFEKRLGGRGLGLQELSLFAATVEHMVHNEAVGRLGSALKIYDLMPTSPMTADEADKVLDTYMMAYILGEHLSKMSLKGVQRMLGEMSEIYSAWKETQAFIRKVRIDITASVGNGDKHELDFATLVKVAETVGEQFGSFQDADCKVMKDTLMKIEDRGTGRVRLSDFYKPALDTESSWQFTESVGYLRQLGALDESNADEPRVMLPNYLGSQSNCIASSDYYSVCCLNECEGLFGHLEKDIAAPETTPARILELISSLPSSSVAAPRIVSTTLRTRLEQIATEHGGLVQLHSRLFSQWMHHAYPRECPFPHMTGTTSQTSPEEWKEISGADAGASKEELIQFTSTPNKAVEQIDDMHDLMMWTHEEELLVVRAASVPVVKGGSSYIMTGVRNVVLFAAVLSFAFSIVRTGTGASGHNEKSQKFMV